MLLSGKNKPSGQNHSTEKQQSESRKCSYITFPKDSTVLLCLGNPHFALQTSNQQRLIE
jgi:hypothetical protein